MTTTHGSLYLEMGLFTHHILPAPPPEFESSHALWPGLQQFFITGVGLGLDQVTTLTTKWGKDDWWACVSSQAAVQDSLKSLQELAASWYASHDPLTLALAFCVWSSTACFVLQELTNNLSQFPFPGDGPHSVVLHSSKDCDDKLTNAA